MGNKLSLVPKYFRDFNIENRAAKEMASREIDLSKIKPSPRHPSTIEHFKKREGYIFTVSWMYFTFVFYVLFFFNINSRIASHGGKRNKQKSDQ